VNAQLPVPRVSDAEERVTSLETVRPPKQDRMEEDKKAKGEDKAEAEEDKKAATITVALPATNVAEAVTLLVIAILVDTAKASATIAEERVTLQENATTPTIQTASDVANLVIMQEIALRKRQVPPLAAVVVAAVAVAVAAVERMRAIVVAKLDTLPETALRLLLEDTILLCGRTYFN